MMSFLTPLLTISAAEMGDKTMFLVMALASKQRLKDMILGISLAAFILNLFAVAVGSAISNILPSSYMKFIAGILFLGFAVWTVIERRLRKREKEKNINFKMKPFVMIALTFILAEFGDKTQFTAMSIAASSPGDEFAVFFGSMGGLLLGDTLGIFIGKVFGSRIPEKVFTWLSAAVFALFGIITIWEAFQLFHFIP